MNTPAAKRVIQLETQETDPQAMQGFIKALASEVSARPSDERLTLVRRMAKATHATDASIRTVIEVLEGMGKVFDLAHGSDGAAAPPEISQAIEQIRSQRELIEASVLTRMLFTYRSLSDAELEAYVKFWESDDGQWFSRMGTQAIINAMRKAGEQAAGELKAFQEARSHVAH